jgi:dihydrodipicolinate synthase/N-acetylneuraminate lyase
MNPLPQPPPWVLEALRNGLVIPAHPLALTRRRRLDERHQRALTRYYLAAGAGGLAVGVHTTQFAIREPKHGLLRPVLELAASTARENPAAPKPTVLIAGLCGPTRQAVSEAEIARDLGYHAGLLSLGALRNATQRELLAHCRTLARGIPLIGFYLQPAAGGRLLPFQFWRRFVEIPNVIAIKIAPFNRYQTLDVVRAVAEAGRAGQIALYTGNDDHILLDLCTEFVIPTQRSIQRLRIVGGLLGQWACWTRRAVELLKRCQQLRHAKSVPATFLSQAEQLTDANAALFDPAHGFAGCIAGIHEVLRRQGLLANTLCLDPSERLSPGQAAEITRVSAAYPHLTDDDFVREHLDCWLKG